MWKCHANSTIQNFEIGEELKENVEEIVKLVKDLKLDCQIEEVEELLDYETKDLSDEELIKLKELKVVEEKAKEEEKEEKNTTISCKKILLINTWPKYNQIDDLSARTEVGCKSRTKCTCFCNFYISVKGFL